MPPTFAATRPEPGNPSDIIRPNSSNKGSTLLSGSPAVENKRHQVSLIASILLLLVLIVLAFWQTSFTFELFHPARPVETVVLWGISMLIGLGLFALGFMVFRSLLKLYIERRVNRLGSKIKTKLVVGALGLSILPVVCLVVFSFYFLNRTLDKWFSWPITQILDNSLEVARELNDVMRQKAETDARWIGSLPDVAAALDGRGPGAGFKTAIRQLVDTGEFQYVGLVRPGDDKAFVEFGEGGALPPLRREALGGEIVSGFSEDEDYVYARVPVRAGGRELGAVVVVQQIPPDVVAGRSAIQEHYDAYSSFHGESRRYRYFYSGLLGLIAIFVIFVATWLALFLSKQIIVPIEALVQATGQLSSGHLDYRVHTPAIDELAALVHSFNHMTQQLESKTHQLQESNQGLAQANAELDDRRRLIEAILESITPGVVSVSAEGEIRKANSSLRRIFPAETVEKAKHVADLFSQEDRAELAYMMNRAQRIGLASGEFTAKQEGQILHLAVTVSALEREGEQKSEEPGFVIVLEDTTELLRAQKSAAWNEVARRVAHEIKNPLTPIALSAERMSRLLGRFRAAAGADDRRKIQEQFAKCAATIAREVETLRDLVDEFSQFSRFPTAQLTHADLNSVVEEAVDVFQGRLEGIVLRRQLRSGLADVFIDPQQFKRVVVNLIDNAAEAVKDSWVREVLISTAPGPLPDTVELVIADSGSGISPEDKEKLFLPYFSTKKRGTGLGLAIASRILHDHGAAIRVEDNRPTGSRFIIEVPTAESRVRVAAGVDA